MSPPASDLLDSLPAELSHRLKEDVNQVLLDFIRPNSASQFAQNAPVLAKFREAATVGDLTDDIGLLRNFQDRVPITSYEHYEPFAAKFSVTSCREVDVKDMFSPGLPCFLAISSATSGKVPKLFPRYRPPPQCVWDPTYLTIPSSAEGTVLAPSSLKYSKVLKIDREDGQSSQELALCSVSSGFLRMQMNWDVKDDMDRLDLWVPGETAPFALCIVEGYRPFFILHALFALADPQVTTMCFLFANVFATLMQFIDDEWLLLVECIENGIIPDIENNNLLRGALEKHFNAKPVRAAELRKIGPPRGVQGWAVLVWPALKTFIGITGGSAAASVPKVTHVLGPSVTIQSRAYGSSECVMALPYLNANPAIDLKLTMVDGVIEFVEASPDEPSGALLSAWELIQGHRYQPVVTTRDGLWRYRLGDVLLVKGFAPNDGMPVINYLHRLDGALALSFGTMCTESELTTAIVSVSDQWIGHITEFTVVRDEREKPATFGFLVEIEGKIGNGTKMAPQLTLDALMELNLECRIGFWQGRLRTPTIRLLSKGTFDEYRKRKSDIGISMSHVKVPVVLSDEASKEWFLSKVITEL